MKIRGAYAGAVLANLKAVARFLDGGAYAGFLLYALNGMQAANAPLNTCAAL